MMRAAAAGRVALAFALGLVGPLAADASTSRDTSFKPASFAAAPRLATPSLVEELRAIEAKASKAAECVALCDLAASVEAHPLGVASAEPPNRSEDAWGNYRFSSELAPSKNRFGFTGHYWDKEASLYYAKARFYDPFTARFTQSDSFLGTIDDPPSLHRYQYANANPTMFVDPTGHLSVLRREQVAVIVAATETAGAVISAGAAAAATSVAAVVAAVGVLVHAKVEETKAELKLESQLAAYRADQAERAMARDGIVILENEDQWQTLLEARRREQLRAAGVELGRADLKGQRGRYGASPSAEASGSSPPTSASRPLVYSEEDPNRRGDRTSGSGTVVTPWGTRDVATGKFTKGSRRGEDPVEDFIRQAEAHGYDVVGTEISFKSPVGTRRLDVVLRDPRTGRVSGVEVKSSMAEFDKFNPQQNAADRFINRFGARAIGEKAKDAGVVRIDSVTKVLWPPPPGAQK